MAQTTLGINIGDELLSAVLVSGTGREARVTACASAPLSASGGPDALAEGLGLLRERLGALAKADRCVVGLSLSCLSLRNLSLPFSEEKKIRQILPFELEEQLLLPVDEQIVATVFAAKEGDGTVLLAAAAAKNMLRERLRLLQAASFEPDSICPAAYALADRLCRTDHAGGSFLLLHSEPGAVQLAQARQGEILFLRRLCWPDSVFTQGLFRLEEDGIVLPDPAAAAEAVRNICETARRSLDYFTLHSGQQHAGPEYFVLSGLLQHSPGLFGQIEQELHLPGRLSDLVRDGAAALAPAAAGQWRAAVHDPALALALHQTGRRSRETGLEFRQGEFAPAGHLLRSKQELTALGIAAGLLLLVGGGWLAVSQHQLQQQHDSLTGKMEQIFAESFPGVRPGADPLMHMRSRRKSMDSSPAALPVFTEEKRVLATLADISARIPASIQLQVDRLQIDQQSVSIRGATDAFNNVNTMQSLLAKSSRYAEVKIVSAAKGKEDEGILFEIRMTLRAEAGS
ncbi:MAG: type II secretion system protein GspL [Candidatus Electronema sp. V4]|uniref:type II secretion system protein GspL n=1 Tax=Candidatus Electronema sp. V4 TaxID=3454756 RepID=UPI0040559A18